MLVDLRELLSGNEESKDYELELDMMKFDTSINCYDISSKSAVSLHLDKLSKSSTTVKAEGTICLAVPCDRCLETVETTIDYKVDTVVDIDETSKIEDQEEQDYIDGYNLDVDELVFGEVLLSLPGKTLCKEDCKGLCLRCGNNLNIKDCGCDRESLDPRMSVFKDILTNFKEV